MRLTLRRLAGLGDDDLVADGDRAGGDRARQSRGNRGSGRLTHCTGKRNGLSIARLVDLDGLEMLEQRRPVVPGASFAERVVTLSP